jgi:acyl-coenzyme A thioesterase PaaI-like protein
VDIAADQATGGVTTDVVLHFLAPNRIGPVRATARSLGVRTDGHVCRVEVRDEGGDRVTAVAIVTARV